MSRTPLGGAGRLAVERAGAAPAAGRDDDMRIARNRPAGPPRPVDEAPDPDAFTSSEGSVGDGTLAGRGAAVAGGSERMAARGLPAIEATATETARPMAMPTPRETGGSPRPVTGHCFSAPIGPGAQSGVTARKLTGRCLEIAAA
jgi:hypothetical protein